jgi:hypothetical protein
VLCGDSQLKVGTYSFKKNSSMLYYVVKAVLLLGGFGQSQQLQDCLSENGIPILTGDLQTYASFD